MKNSLLFIMLAVLSLPVFAAIDANLNAIIKAIAVNGIEESDNDNAETGGAICKAGGGSSCYLVTSIGQGICKAGGGSSCYLVTSIGQGICKAGGGSSCYLVTSIGQGICKAGGGSSCYLVTSIGQGICQARGGGSCYSMSVERALSLPVKDTEWRWDQFRNPNSLGNMWACRGTSTGQFAEEINCAGEDKSDSTWPNN
jgi:uncharacterized membrane protein